LSEKDTVKVPPGLTPKIILDLGKELASYISYQDQKVFLENVLEEYFGGEAFIWLTTPPKAIPGLSRADIPFDPNEVSENNPPDQNDPHTLKINDHIWHLVSMTRGTRNFGKILLKLEAPLGDGALEALNDIREVASLAIHATLQSHMQNWREKQLALVRSVTAQISQITDLGMLTRQITQLIQETFNYYYVAVFLISEESGRLHFKDSAGSDESERPDFERESHPGFAMGEHMIGHVAQTGHELVANDVTEEPRYKEVNSLDETKSEVVIPLKVESRIFGVFDVQSDERYAFDENDLLVLRALADNIAIAIQSTRLFQEVQTRADQLATVSEVSRAITYILDIDELLQRIVSLIHERFGFPYVHLYTIDPVQEKITFKAGSGERTALYSQAGASFDLDAEKGILSWVYQHGETKRVNDVHQEPLFLESPYAQVVGGSEMAVPLYFGGQILGVLDIQSGQTNAFSSSDQQLMETLADNIAIAIRNARLYRSEKWRRQVSESLRDVAGLLSENTALENVLDAVLVQLQKSLPCDVAGIWLFDQDGDKEISPDSRELYLAAYKTDEAYPDHTLSEMTFVPDNWVKNALNRKEPTIRHPDDTKGPIAEEYELSQSYSSIAAPLYTGEEILGMLTLVHHSPGRYGAESQKLTATFANYAAIAIENTRLYTTSQEQAWISTILLQVAQATQSLTNLDELVTTIVRLTPMVVGVKGCALFLREPESEIFLMHALYGIGDSSEEITLDQPIPLTDAPILEELLLTREPLQVRNPEDDFNLPERFSRQMSKDNLTLLPLVSRDEILGAFLLANEPGDNAYPHHSDSISEERLRIIQGIIQQTAIAIENIRLLEGKQEEAYVSTVLLQAAQAAVSSAELDDILESMVQIMPILVGINSSVLYLWDEDEKQFKTSHAITKGEVDQEDLLGMTYGSGEFPMLDTVLHNNRPIVYPFVDTTLPPEDWDLALPDEGQIDPTPILQSRYPILMGFPLSVKEDVFGVLLAQDNVVATNRERRFELIWGIAQQASLAIQNDILNREMLDRQRLEREFQLAREIQQTFLPDRKPEMSGWELDVHWETARQVGGDFYDYFLLPDGRLAFVIADVSDKGLAASLYMTVTRTLLRAAALETPSPARTLERVNDLLLANSQNGLFVTTFYGALSLEDGTLTFTIAGHNPPLIIRHQANEVKEFSMGGIALGALPDIHLPESQLVLEPGDCLLLYTDGVTEAFNSKDQMYGDDRLRRVLQTAIGQKADAVLETLKADLEAFRGNAPLSDDTTMLAICRSRSLANNDGDGRTSKDTIDGTAK